MDRADGVLREDLDGRGAGIDDEQAATGEGDKPKWLEESIMGQIGALLGRTPATSQGTSFGVVQVSRFRVAAGHVRSRVRPHTVDLSHPRYY